ncbi:hypothetical protein [Tepidiforma sp.]|uniref:hypothetical protein n=1 Tax=Tepidiforma sp. TaxID=2682230 RepID=UPI002ADE8F4B|nr:hypothetical protein [Tepidiforma sp.]
MKLTGFMMILGLLAGIAWPGAASPGGAETATREAADRLRELRDGGTPDQDAVVATVNGEPITGGALEVHVATADLIGVGTKSRGELLNDLIDDTLLAQAAVAAGVRVEEWEVDAAIRSGILDPLNSPETPPDIVELVNAALEARGASAATALNDQRVRAAYRGLVLRGRYLQELQKSREEVLADLRRQASIVLLASPGERQ